MRLCSMSTSLPSDLSSRGRQGSTVSDNTTGVTPIVDNVQLSLPAPSPVCDAIEDDESNDGASSVDEDLDEYYLVNEVSPAAADAQDACALVEIKEQNHDPKDSAAATPVEDPLTVPVEPSLCNINDIVASKRAPKHGSRGATWYCHRFRLRCHDCACHAMLACTLVVAIVVD